MDKILAKKIGKVIKFSIIGAVIILTLTIIMGAISGYKALIVNGWSMEPIIKYRSLAIVKKLEPQNIKIGDAITYHAGNSFITHQLFVVKDGNEVIAEFRDMADYEASWEEEGGYLVDFSHYGVNVVAWYSGQEFTENMSFTTKGTQNTLNPFDGSLDGAKTYDQIYGVVMFSLPWLGNLIMFIQNNILLFVATFAALIILYNLVQNDLAKNK